MRIQWGVLGQLIVALPILLVVQPVWAEEEGESAFVTGHLSLDNPEGQMTNDNGQITNNQPATTVEEWFAQIEASLVQITGVRVETSEAGLQVVLETAEGELSAPVTETVGNAVIADIPNAVLALPEGEEFQQANPIEGVALVSVTSLPNNRVRVAITGTEAPPIAAVRAEAQGLVFGVTLGAETDAAQDEDAIQVVVTATRTEEDILDVPRSVTVVTREEIEQQTALSRNLTDILGTLVPSVGPPNAGRRSDGQNLRGRPPAILIDGVPQVSNNSFSPVLGFIAPDSIERIEVVPGPSAIYGQGATGGIINIITRQASEERLQNTIEVGTSASAAGDAFLTGASFGNYLEYGFSVNEGIFDLVANVSRNDVGNFFDPDGELIPNGNLGFDDLETLNLFGKVGADFSDQQRLQLSFNHTRNSFPRSAITNPEILEIPGRQFARGIERNVEFRGTEEPGDRSTNINLSYTNDNLFFNSQAQFVAYYRNSAYRERGAFDSRNDGFFDGIIRVRQSDEVFGGRVQFDTSITNRLNLLWGADYEDQRNGTTLVEFFDEDIFDASGGEIAQKVDEATYVPAYDLNNLGLFAQLQWDISNRFILSGGIRHDWFELSVDGYTPLFDSNFARYDGPPVEGGQLNFDDTVFNVGAVYRITPEVNVYANFAQGFLVPSVGFAALGFPVPGFSLGSDLQALEAQKVDNYELGIRANWDRIQLSLAGFYTYSALGSNLINNENAFEIVRSPQRNYGFEASVNWQPDNAWQLGSSIGYVIGEIDRDNTGEYVNLISSVVPPLKLTAYVENETLPGWLNRFQFLYVGDRNSAFEDGLDPVPIEGYFVVDFISGLQVGPGTLELGIQNLFNRQYQVVGSQVAGGFDEQFNILQPGRTIRLGYRVTF
jgi:iron complex outermembrane receptor protein